jgi:peptidoglycan/LPS O-acetylase OafA/YrhL
VLTGIVMTQTAFAVDDGVWVFVGNVLSLQGILTPVLEGNGPLWSLSYEVWFYVLGGAAAYLMLDCKLRKRPWTVLALLVAAVGLTVFTVLDAVLLFGWVVGALVCRSSDCLNRWGFFVLGTIVSMFGAVSLQLTDDTVSASFEQMRAFLPSREIAILMLCVGIGLVLPKLSRLQPRQAWLQSFESMGTRLAASSYTLYLIHYPILTWWAHVSDRSTEVNVNSMLKCGMKTVSCFVVAWVMYMCFEKHTATVRRVLKGQF